MLEQTKALVFDAYGTLLNLVSIEKILQPYFGEKAPEIGSLWRAKQLEYTWLRQIMGRYCPFSEITQDALRYSLEKMGIKDRNTLSATLIGAYQRVEAFAEVEETLKQLGEKYLLATLSNADLDMLLPALAHNHIDRYFDYILSADSIKQFKPRAEVYQIALDALGQPREVITFVSSNAWDIAGAHHFGFRTCWVNRSGAPLDDLDAEANSIIGHLDALAPNKPFIAT